MRFSRAESASSPASSRMTSPAATHSPPAAAATASTSRTRRQLDEIHASRGGRVALGGASACRGLPRGPEGQGMPGSGAARNAGTNATLANARQNGIEGLSVDSKSPSSSSRARAFSSGSVSSAMAPRASASRYARSAAPRRTAAATRTGSVEAAEPPSTSSRAAASTARAANKIPSAPSLFFTPNSFTSASARRPSSKGARGKKRFASSSFRAPSAPKTAAMTETRGSNRSPGLFSSIRASSSERDSERESAARRVGTHRERRTASRVRSASRAPVHDARESRTCVTHASRTLDASRLDTRPFSKPGNTCSTSASVTVTLFARRRDSNNAPSPSASSLRNAPRGNRSGSNALEAGGSKRDASGYLGNDDRVCSSSETKKSGERNPLESERKGLPPARARNDGPPADPAAVWKTPSAVSKTGSARNRSSRAPSTAPPGASGANHRVCSRNARRARRAETASTFSERLARRLSNAAGTTLAAARHLRSGTDSAGAASVWNARAARAASGVAAARATAESSTPAAEAGRA